ncbi:unnamed protein product [Discosporangium mesarthrocarpum]
MTQAYGLCQEVLGGPGASQGALGHNCLCFVAAQGAKRCGQGSDASGGWQPSRKYRTSCSSFGSWSSVASRASTAQLSGSDDGLGWASSPPATLHEGGPTESEEGGQPRVGEGCPVAAQGQGLGDESGSEGGALPAAIAGGAGPPAF